jgi:hypothetical protein
MKVIGLMPSSVRLDLQPLELPVLIDELLTRIEALAGSLREEHELHGQVTPDRLRDATDWLAEYRDLLAAISDDRGHSGVEHAISVITPTPLADQVVRACARSAAEQLAELLRNRAADRQRLRPAAKAAAAWTDTLVDLRYLDEEGPEPTRLA